MRIERKARSRRTGDQPLLVQMRAAKLNELAQARDRSTELLVVCRGQSQQTGACLPRRTRRSYLHRVDQFFICPMLSAKRRTALGGEHGRKQPMRTCKDADNIPTPQMLGVTVAVLPRWNRSLDSTAAISSPYSFRSSTDTRATVVLRWRAAF